MNISEGLKSAKEIGAWLRHQVDGIDIPSGKREAAAIALFQQTLDIADAIVVLLEKKLPGPALTLARPMHEAFVRAVWLLNHATESGVDQFVKGKCPNFPTLLKEIGDDYETGGNWIKGMSELNLKSFHDLTHGGMEHVVRRMTEEAIEPNYRADELLNLLKVRNQYYINTTIYLLRLVSGESQLLELSTKRREWDHAL